MNKDVQEEFGLTEAYKNVLTSKNIDRVMKMDADKLRDFISKLPESMKTSLYAEAKSRFDRDEIDSRGTIQVFEDEYGISFKDNAPISEKINK